MNEIPIVWREMRVIFVPKLEKESYFSPGYLYNSAVKLCHKKLVLLLQLHHQPEQQPLYLYNQHALTVGRSTDSALAEAFDLLEEAVYDKKCILAVSIEFNGAFENISFSDALTGLPAQGVDLPICAWYDILKGKLLAPLFEK